MSVMGFEPSFFATEAAELRQLALRRLGDGAIGILVASAVILLCAITVPKADRRAALRAPLVLLGLHTAFVLVRLPLAEESGLARVLELCGLFFLLLALGRALFVLVVDVLLGARLSKPLPRIIRDIIQGFVYASAAAIVLRQMGVEPGSLLTTSALLTAVIGLSLQETLGNLFAGLAIQAQRPFEVGDWIGLDEDFRNMGRVIEINWRATTVLTNEQVELIIPNGVLAKTTIRNFTKPTKTTRRSIEVEAPYDASPRKVEDALLAAITAVPGVLTSPAPSVLLRSFAQSGMVYQLQFWIDDFGARDRIESSVRQRVWSSFQRAGIVIPFPIRTLYTHAITPETEAEAQRKEIAARKAALEEVDFIATLPEGPRERLAIASKTCHYMPGEVVIRQGDTGSELYIVQKGEVVVLIGRAQGSVAEVARLGPGKFFGEMSLMTGEKRAATVQATTDTDLVLVGKAAFHDIFVKDPRLIESITEALIERQSAIEENLTARATRSRAEVAETSTALLAKIRQFFAI